MHLHFCIAPKAHPDENPAVNRLEKLGVRFPYFVAPMVGISHVAFRELVRFYTPPSLQPLLFTEMISSRRLPQENVGEVDSLRTSPGEDGLIPQLLCNEESFIEQSMYKLRALYPWGIDINMGCPASQTLKHNWGVQLMHNKDKAADVVRFAKKYCDRPISVKLRAALGREFDEKYLLEFTAALEDAGADWLTIHCRTQAQGHRGYAHWTEVENVAKTRSIPIVANGDIHTWEQAISVRNNHGVDGVMIARAAMARPWILWQIAHKLGHTEKPTHATRDLPPFEPEDEAQEYFASLLRLTCLLEEHYGDHAETTRKIHLHLTLSSRWLFFGHDFLVKAKRAKTLTELRDFLNTYRDGTQQKMLSTARI
jgi:tRNA-dihydrouridine synthase B